MFFEGLRNWLFLLFNCLAVYYVAVTIDGVWRVRFIWITFIVGGIAAIYGLMQSYGIENIWQTKLIPFGSRPVSTFGNPNFLSSYLLLLCPVLVVFFAHSKKLLTKWLCFFLLVSVIAAIIATMTRSTWVGLIVTFLLFPLHRSIRELVVKNKVRLVVIFVVVTMGILFWPKSSVGGYAKPWDRVIEIQNIRNSRGYGPWHQRILIWSSCWNMVRDHFWFGKGWGQLELFYPYYQGKALFHPILKNFRTHANNAHNELLEVWSQTGFIGTGIYFWFWVVLIVYGFRCSNNLAAISPENSVLSWALVSGSVGMFVDNFFGNVSLHFAMPAMLFWWQIGLLFGLSRTNNVSKLDSSEWVVVPLDNIFKRTALILPAIFILFNCVYNFRREFQEIYYFKGFKMSKSSSSNIVDSARQNLENAWRWYPREVNTNYELANVYARLGYQTGQSGLTDQSEEWRNKAVWGYVEAIRSNCGYDEIYLNLASTLAQMRRIEGEEGALYYYTRALAINPLSTESYTYLGNIFLQDLTKYKDSAAQLFKQATHLFPDRKEFWVTLSFIQIRANQNEDAYQSVYHALKIDPFFQSARSNLRYILGQLKRGHDPLAEADRLLNQIETLIQTKNWKALCEAAEILKRIFPSNFQIRFILANSYFEIRDFPKAEDEYKEALKMDTQNSSALINLALTYRLQNKTELASETYKKILEINPNDAQAMNLLKTL